jgi:ribonuclease HI
MIDPLVKGWLVVTAQRTKASIQPYSLNVKFSAVCRRSTYSSLTWLSNDRACEGYEVADNAAKWVARQQPKDMRSASMSYVKQAIKEKWRARRKINKHVENAKKSVTARYLQLKLGHAVTAVHLFKIDRAQDARCWWSATADRQ